MKCNRWMYAYIDVMGGSFDDICIIYQCLQGNYNLPGVTYLCLIVMKDCTTTKWSEDYMVSPLETSLLHLCARRNARRYLWSLWKLQQ